MPALPLDRSTCNPPIIRLANPRSSRSSEGQQFSFWLVQCLAPSSGGGVPPPSRRAVKRAGTRGMCREDAPDGAHGGRDALPPEWSQQASRRSRQLRTAMRHVRQIQGETLPSEETEAAAAFASFPGHPPAPLTATFSS